MAGLVYKGKHYKIIVVSTITILTLSMVASVYYFLNELRFPTSISTSAGVFLLYAMALRFVKKFSGIAVRNNTVFVKNVFVKTRLAPLEHVNLEPMFNLGVLKLTKVRFSIDGMKHSFFVLNKKRELLV
jgi:hypothetical protein